MNPSVHPSFRASSLSAAISGPARIQPQNRSILISLEKKWNKFAEIVGFAAAQFIQKQSTGKKHGNSTAFTGFIGTSLLQGSGTKKPQLRTCGVRPRTRRNGAAGGIRRRSCRRCANLGPVNRPYPRNIYMVPGTGPGHNGFKRHSS